MTNPISEECAAIAARERRDEVLDALAGALMDADRIHQPGACICRRGDGFTVVLEPHVEHDTVIEVDGNPVGVSEGARLALLHALGGVPAGGGADGGHVAMGTDTAFEVIEMAKDILHDEDMYKRPLSDHAQGYLLALHEVAAMVDGRYGDRPMDAVAKSLASNAHTFDPVGVAKLPDSWEQLKRDVTPSDAIIACDYFGHRDIYCRYCQFDGEDCAVAMAEDIIRRAKAIAGVIANES